MAEENTKYPRKTHHVSVSVFRGGRGSPFKVGERFTSFALFTWIVLVKWNSAGLVSCIVHAFFCFFWFRKGKVETRKNGCEMLDLMEL